MIDRLLKELKSMEQITAWRVEEEVREGKELFFVKKTLDMNRAKTIQVWKVTLFVAHGDDYLGASATELTDAMADEEIKVRLLDTALAASFVKNKSYALAKPKPYQGKDSDDVNLTDWLSTLTEAVYGEDDGANGAINSAEFFVNKRRRRVVTSEGIDIAYTKYDGLIEVIADCNEGEEPVELMWLQSFGQIQANILAGKVKELLIATKERSIAKPMLSFENIPIILAGEAVKDFFEYFRDQASARLIYEGLSSYKVNECVQGDLITGDKIDMVLTPGLEGSSHAQPCDNEGIVLAPLHLIDQGKLTTLIADSRFGAYMASEPTGKCPNMKVALGSHNKASMGKAPYIELVAFSAFQMNHLTGDFGGEIRLARYFDGESLHMLTGGSLSANINEVKSGLKLSDIMVQHNTYMGPSYVYFEGLNIAGSI